MMFRSFLLQALFGDTGRSKDSGGGGGINTTGNNAATFPKVVVGDEMSSSFPSSSSIFITFNAVVVFKEEESCPVGLLLYPIRWNFLFVWRVRDCSRDDDDVFFCEFG